MKVERRFASEPTAVRAARTFVAETLCELPMAFVDDMVLLVSELATNSVTHARSAFTLRLEVDLQSLRIEITDDGSELPRKRTPLIDEPYGRGLHIVESLAESWGVGLSAEGGKTIWVVVPLPATVTAHDEATVSTGNGTRRSFDDLVPAWLFGVRPMWLRAVIGAAAPAVAIPIFPAVDPQASTHPGGLVALLLVAVTCVAGSVAAAVGGIGLLIGLIIFSADAIGVGGLALLTAALCALAHRLEKSVDGVRRLDAELRDEAAVQSGMRRRAERIASQAEAVLALGSVLDTASSVRGVAEAALHEINIPTSPTFGTVAIVEESHLRVIASRGARPDLVQELERIDLTRSAWLSAVLSGEPSYVEDREEFAARYPSALVLQMYQSGSWLVSPFRAEDTLGLLSLHFDEPQPLKEYRLYFSLVSELLGTSLERARSEEQLHRQHRELQLAFAERDRIARTLSTSLLPPVLPRIQGFAAAAWLVPASVDQVAGDFYDLFAVEDGWVAVLGDVCGKGAEAAAVTSLARYATRASALENPDPAHVAHVANQALVAEPSDLFCTAAIVRYLRHEGAVEVTLAGHLQARLVCDGDVQRIGKYGAALGLGVERPNVTRYGMPPGAVVVLFSDGLVERDPSFGERELDHFLSEKKGVNAQRLSLELRALIDRLRPGHLDDVAVMVLERTD